VASALAGDPTELREVNMLEPQAAPAHRHDPLWNEGRATGPRPRWANLAIGLSLAAHAGLVWYVYESKFAPHYKVYADTAIQAQLVPLDRSRTPPPEPPKQPPVQRDPPPKHELNLHVPDLPPSFALPDIPSFSIPDPPAPEPLAPEPARPTPRVIANPNWASRPNAEDMARYYPERAQRLGKSGGVVLECQVTAKGAVAGCAVLSEDPAEFGFGDAALKLARLFKLKPGMVGDQAVEGAMVKIPIAFRIG
jgi:protein TonB